MSDDPMRVSLIVAEAENHVIGHDNRLPWHLPADLARFKRLTMGHHIVMGRRTYEAIGRALPGRTNVVLTRRRDFDAGDESVRCVASLDEGLALAREAGDDEPFVIGGGQVYEEALAIADRIYLTRVQGAFDGDAFFPELDPAAWRVTESESFRADAKNPYDYEFLVLERSPVSAEG